MGEFTGVSFLAQASLVMFADEMSDTAALARGHVVSVGTVGAARALSAVGVAVVFAEGSVDFGRLAEGGKGSGKISVECECWRGSVLWVEDLMG
jgi:hypothetical protein